MQDSRAPGRDLPAGTSPTPTPSSSRNLVFDVTNWHPKPVKRPRPVKSCTECRRRKLRCDRRCPCSQCQRSYRVCRYGSGDGSGSRGNDPNNSLVDSDVSDGGVDDDDDSMSGGGGNRSGGGERPLKRHFSRPLSGPVSMPQSAAGSVAGSSTSVPMQPSNSSLSLLLNPTSPSSSPSILRAPNFITPAAANMSSAALISAPMLACPHGTSANMQSPLLTLNGHELRQFTSDLIEEFSARMGRLEKLVLAKDTSALSNVFASPSSAAFSRNRNLQPSDHPGSLIVPPSSTMHCLATSGSRTKLFGESSTRVLLNLFDDAKDFVSDRIRREPSKDVFNSLERAYKALRDEHQQARQPISVYVDSMMPVQKRMADILPRRDVCDLLLEAYFNVNDVLHKVIHVPSFRHEYNAYWDNRTNNDVDGSSTSESFLPRLLCVMCISSRFNAHSKGLCYDRSDGVHIPTACALVRSWLDTARRRQTADLETLQAEVLLLQAYRSIEPRSQLAWREMGLISRTAMAMGLHRDPSEFPQKLTVFQAESRRKLWFIILDIDLHSAMASNLPTSLRYGEYTCRPPRHLNDADLYPEMTVLPPPKPMDQFTDNHVSVYGASTMPLRMRATDLLARIDSLRDYTEVLEVGGELEKALDDINCIFPRNLMLGTREKIEQWRERASLDMHMRRPLLALYRPFALGAPDHSPPPAAITDVFLKSSMATLTYIDELDQGGVDLPSARHILYIYLWHEIMQASFSVCYYIKKAVEAEAAQTATSPPLGSGGIASGFGTADGMNKGAGGGQGPGTAKMSPGSSTSATPTGAENGHAASSTAPSDPKLAVAAVAAAAARNQPASSSRAYPLIWSSTHMIRTVERTLENLARLAGDLSSDLRDILALAIVLGSVQPAASPAERNEHIYAQVGRMREMCFDTLRQHASPAVRAVVSTSDMSLSHVPGWYNRSAVMPNETMEQLTDEFWDIGFWGLWEIQPESATNY